MQQIKLPIGIGKSVIVTDDKGNSRERKVVNHDGDKYVINFSGSIMNEYWSQGYVRAR